MAITNEQLSDYQFARANFIHWLTAERMYATLGLMQQCTFSLTDDPQHIASIALRPNQAPVVTMNVKLLGNAEYFKYAILHELRHIPQVARFGGEDFLSSVPWPDFVDTPVKRKVIYRLYSNIAMDMALNEDLRRLLGEEKFMDAMGGIIPTVQGAESQGKLCYVTNPEWQRDQSFVYYMLKLIEEQDQKDQDGGEGGPQGYQQMDDHDIEGEGEGAEGEALRGSLRDLLKRAEQESKVLANQKGYGASDTELTLEGNSVNQQVKDFIRRIKVKVNRLYEGKSERRYAFEKFNRLWPKMGLPGHKAHKTKVPGIVIVLDTSGSVVCDPTVFGQLRGAVLELERQQKVAAIYCCDTELTRMKSNTQATGGGGTLLAEHHFMQIREDLGLKPTDQITIVALGDGDWPTEQLKKTKNVDYHELVLQRGGL